MKLRRSDGHNFSETFQANDETSFVANGIPALRIFRLATGRMVHRGEVHRDEFFGVQPQLGIEIDGRWFAPGNIHKSSGPHGWPFFQPFRVLFLHNHAVTVEELNTLDAAQLAASAATWWAGVYDAWRWSGALDAAIMETVDKLPDGDE